MLSVSIEQVSYFKVLIVSGSILFVYGYLLQVQLLHHSATSPP